jgi:hypothetical protein
MRRSAAGGSASRVSSRSKWGRKERRKTTEWAAGRPEDHPREGDVESGLASARVRPVDDERACRREDHVVWVQVEVQDAIAGAGRFQARRRVDLVQLLVKIGEQGGVTAHLQGRRRSSASIIGPCDSVEDERLCRHLQDAGHGIAVAACVLHDERLALRVTTCEEAPQDSSVAEVEDLGSAPGRDEFHVETLGQPVDPRP